MSILPTCEMLDLSILGVRELKQSEHMQIKCEIAD